MAQPVAFGHHLLHLVTYDTVLKRHKREGHARVAQWLAGLADQGSLRAGDLLGQAAGVAMVTAVISGRDSNP